MLAFFVNEGFYPRLGVELYSQQVPRRFRLAANPLTGHQKQGHPFTNDCFFWLN
jgi:hypothetical protein